MNLPNFIIAGGVATGTSFLSHAIFRHPDIYLPKVMRTECGFFYNSWECSKGLDNYSRRWFSDWVGQSSIGERLSLSLHDDFLNVPERIFAALPKVKLFFCLRNPIVRAYTLVSRLRLAFRFMSSLVIERLVLLTLLSFGLSLITTAFGVIIALGKMMLDLKLGTGLNLVQVTVLMGFSGIFLVLTGIPLLLQKLYNEFEGFPRYTIQETTQI